MQGTIFYFINSKVKNLQILKSYESNSYFRRNIKFYDTYKNKKDKKISKLIKKKLFKARSILEIGCANGIKLNQYKQELKSNVNYGIDLSSLAINHGKKRFKNLKLFKLSSLEIEKIKIKFDLIICGFFLYLLDRDYLLKQFELIHQKLNLNGHLVINDFHPRKKHSLRPPHNKKLKYFKATYDKFLEESGLFKKVYQDVFKHRTLIKKHSNTQEAISVFKKINFIKSFPQKKIKRIK